MNVKGMNIFKPSEYPNLEKITSVWVKIPESYGYKQYKTALLDPIEIYKNKSSDEIIKEQTYSLTDRGKRKLIIRPEITPGLAQMVVDMQKNRELGNPQKMFSIGSVFRYENTQKGRKREHIQLNADIFGNGDAWEDAEVIEMAMEVIGQLGLKKSDFTVNLSDREEVEKRLKTLTNNTKELFKLLDKRDKEDISKEIKKIGTSLSEIDKILKEEPQKVKEIIKLLPKGINAKYNPTIVRGFAYYTGMVFEINETKLKRSIVGGGRYDNLIESYGGKYQPAVGFGMGDTCLLELLKETKGEVKAITTFSKTECATVLNKLRKQYKINYIGIKKNDTDIYKKEEKKGSTQCIRIDEDKKVYIRNLKERKDSIIK